MNTSTEYGAAQMRPARAPRMPPSAGTSSMRKASLQAMRSASSSSKCINASSSSTAAGLVCEYSAPVGFSPMTPVLVAGPCSTCAAAPPRLVAPPRSTLSAENARCAMFSASWGDTALPKSCNADMPSLAARPLWPEPCQGHACCDATGALARVRTDSSSTGRCAGLVPSAGVAEAAAASSLSPVLPPMGEPNDFLGIAPLPARPTASRAVPRRHEVFDGEPSSLASSSTIRSRERSVVDMLAKSSMKSSRDLWTLARMSWSQLGKLAAEPTPVPWSCSRRASLFFADTQGGVADKVGWNGTASGGASAPALEA
mmetsp:Transcript_111490/g.314793  ORF Transcript_111490/g.314793 Transcript_111490/m.314793 type:complete len:314 (-) Transcript_111490:289-1230(-)